MISNKIAICWSILFSFLLHFWNIAVSFYQAVLVRFHSCSRRLWCVLKRTEIRNHISPISDFLHWLRVICKIGFKIFPLTHNGKTPSYLSELMASCYLAGTQGSWDADYQIIIKMIIIAVLLFVWFSLPVRPKKSKAKKYI